MKKNLEWLKGEVRAMSDDASDLIPKEDVIELIDSVIPVLPENVVNLRRSAIERGLSLVETLRGVEKSYAYYPYVSETEIWIIENAEEFVRGWIDGFHLEKRYFVLNGKKETMLTKSFGEAVTDPSPTLVDGMSSRERESYLLTEQEIKEFDERYLPFMVAEGEV